MITLSSPKILLSGAQILVGQAVNWNLNSSLRLTGTVIMYQDAAHMAVGPTAAMKTYPINIVVASTIAASGLQAAVENAAIAKYSDLTGATQS